MSQWQLQPLPSTTAQEGPDPPHNTSAAPSAAHWALLLQPIRASCTAQALVVPEFSNNMQYFRKDCTDLRNTQPSQREFALPI